MFSKLLLKSNDINSSEFNRIPKFYVLSQSQPIKRVRYARWVESNIN